MSSNPPQSCLWLGPSNGQSSVPAWLPHAEITLCHSLADIASRLKRNRWAAILVSTHIIQATTSYIPESIRDLLRIHHQPTTALIALSNAPCMQEECQMRDFGFPHYMSATLSGRLASLTISSYQNHLKAVLTPNSNPHPLQASPQQPATSMGQHSSAGHQGITGPNPQWHRITPREKEILFFIGQGETNRDIAHKLCISPTTVKNHLAHIFKKLQVSNRTQAAFVARQYATQGKPLQ